MKILYFSIFVGHFALLDPDPDPATQINADPDPQPCFIDIKNCSWTLNILISFFSLWRATEGPEHT
jgi:hypothetical protein